MALYDENGKITIDDIAAGEDVKRIKDAIAKIDETKAAIEQIKNQSETFSGEAASSMLETSQVLVNALRELEEQLEQQIKFINRTVERYKQLDAEVKNKINQM